MIVKCSLCGGDNEVHPGQKMFACAYCGSACAIDDNRGPEHLILPHERNDRYAEDALRSYLLERRRQSAKIVRIEFAYVPFTMIEDERGRMRTVSAAARTWAPGSLPHPPAGNYRFFDERLAGDEKVHPVEKKCEASERILHLPLYRITFTMRGREWVSTVAGVSWQVYADELPPETPSGFHLPNLLLAGGLFVVFLFIGKAIPRWPARFALLLLAPSLGYAAYLLRVRLVKQR